MRTSVTISLVLFLKREKEKKETDKNIYVSYNYSQNII